jgi:hypothetical protein
MYSPVESFSKIFSERRKINSFKVTVPDNSFFPEDVDIELIPDWKVDQTGQTYGLRAPRGSN